MDLRKEALLDALLSSNMKRMKAILDACPSLLDEPLNEMHQTVMHLVCFRTTNKPCIVKYLLSLKPDLNRKEAAGFTPLLYAAKSGLWSTCVLLLTTEPMGRNLAVDVQTATGWSMLLMMCTAERPEGSALDEFLSLFRLIHSRGVDYGSVSKHGETALHYAALSDNIHAVQFLLVNAPIPVDAVNDLGESALHNAVRAGHVESAMLLLEYGANPLLSTASRSAASGGPTTPLQELERRVGMDTTPAQEQLLARMAEAAEARREGRTPKWVKEAGGEAKSVNRALSPIKAFLASTAGAISSDSKSRTPGLRLGEQRRLSASTTRTHSSPSTRVQAEEVARQSRADTIKVESPKETEPEGDRGRSPRAGQREAATTTLPEPVATAPLVLCFDELINLAPTVHRLTRKRGAKLYSVGTASKKERTCTATISMLIRRIACQRGSFRNFKNLMEGSVSVAWNPMVGANTSNVRWATLFHHRMLQCGRLLSKEQQEGLLEVLDFHQSMTKKKSLAASRVEAHGGAGLPSTPAVLMDQLELEAILVNDMRSYLLSHSMDPDNSLVGLRPSARLVGQLGVDLAAMHAACLALDGGDESTVEHRASGVPLRSRGLTCAAAVKGNIHYADFPAESYPAVTKRNLRALFVGTFQFLPDEELLQKSRALIEILKHDQLHASLWEERGMLRRGDLVIAYTHRAPTPADPFESIVDMAQDAESTPDDAATACYSIMRYSGAYMDYWTAAGQLVDPATPGAHKGCLLRLYSIAEEVAVRDVDVRVVVPLPPACNQALASGKLSSIMEMVDGPIASAIRHLLAEMSAAHTTLMVEKGLDVAILQRCTTFSVGLQDVTAIAEQLQILSTLVDDFDEQFADFLSETRATIERRHHALVSSVGLLDQEFFPARATLLHQLLELPVEQLLRQRLISYKLNIESTFDHLRHVRAGLVDGTEKKNITSWWLGMISSKQRSFLKEIGYDFDAVPSDYIETRPESIDVVCNNLALIQDCLLQNGTTDKHQVKKRLLYPLMNEIYPRVNEFISNIRFSLCDGLGISAERFSLESASVLLKDMGAGDQREFLAGLLKDLEYLEAIKVLEAEFMGANWEAVCGISAAQSTAAVRAEDLAEALGDGGEERTREERTEGERKGGERKGEENRERECSGEGDLCGGLRPAKDIGGRLERLSFEAAMNGGQGVGRNGSGKLMNDIRTSSESVGVATRRRGGSKGPAAPAQRGALAARDQNIVPMSGLIMNVFYRLENELRTVLEVWALERLQRFDKERERLSPRLSPPLPLPSAAEEQEPPLGLRLAQSADVAQLQPPPEAEHSRQRTRRLRSRSQVMA